MPLWYDSKTFPFGQGFPEKNFESKRGGFHKNEDDIRWFCKCILLLPWNVWKQPKSKSHDYHNHKEYGNQAHHDTPKEHAQHVHFILVAEHQSHCCVCNTTSNSDGVGVCETRDGKDGINISCPADDHCVIELGATVVLYSQTLTKELAGNDNRPCSPFL